MSGDGDLVPLQREGRVIAHLRRAATLWDRFRGLMLAPPLPPGEALWLPACSSVHTAFLRAPIDLLFLKGERIARVCRRIAPWRVVVCPGADSVIELAAGEADRLGLAPGQDLRWGRERRAEERAA
jgi:uncharacterized membrane protein (UPF0127 family)